MRKLVHILASIITRVDYILCSIGLKKPVVIVVLDGGISSQMFNYIKGARFAVAGYDVRYDTRWFSQRGYDVDGRFARTYELKEMFPQTDVKIISPFWARQWYARFFKHKDENGLVMPKDIRRTTYLGSHYKQDPEAYKILFPKYFNEQTMAPVQIPWSTETDVIHCGVHVRRGDLAKPQPEYGMVSEHYFENAIHFVQTKYKNVLFHFFSDEMDWVEQNIIPRVDIHYDLIKGHKAWQDLALLSKCDVVIASQGSFGRMAAQLRTHAELVLCKTDLIPYYTGQDTTITYVD